MTNVRLTFLALTLLLAGAAVSQQSEPAVAPPTAPDAALSTACDGAWRQVDNAIQTLSRMPQRPLALQERTRVLCLLETIGRTTFDARSSQFNSYMAASHAQLVVSAYGPAAYDFFAEQLAAELPDSVRRGVHTELLGAGHPEAFRLYFAERREKLNRNEDWITETGTAPSIFEPLIMRGRCSDGMCSNRISETMQIIAANLDILDLELQATESFPAPSKTVDAEQHAQHFRDAARTLRAAIGRIKRGDAVIGAASPR